MLAAVLGCNSSAPFPALFEAGLRRMLEQPMTRRVATISQPSFRRSSRITRYSPAVRFFPDRPDDAVEHVADVGERVREEVTVGVERDIDRRVAELRLQQLRMCAGCDHQCGV